MASSLRPRAAWALAALLAPGLLACSDEPGARAQNVILISIDTLRPDHLGCYGYERDTSPTIDRVAAAGTVFEDVTSSAPWTLPGHASMLTGLYPSSHGVKNHEFTLGDTPSIAKLLADAGLETFAVVNSHNIADPRYGLRQGFPEDEFLYVAEQQVIPGQFRPDGEPRTFIANKGRDITREAIKLIEEHREDRFFLFLHYYDVHTDFTPAPEYKQKFVEAYDGPLDENGVARTMKLVGYRRRGETITADDARWLRQMYDAEIRQLDDILEGFFRYLDDRGLTENTLIVITSDHGEEYGEHGGVLHGRSQYQELLAIPLILRGPGVPVGRRIDYPVSLVDVAPTILRLAGVKADTPFDGIDLTRVWHDDSYRPTRFLYGEADHNVYIDGKEHADVNRMARIGYEKLHYNDVLDTFEFYDIENDPFEQRLLAEDGLTDQQVASLQQLRAALERLMATEGTGNPIPPPSPEELAKLKELGY